MWQLDKGVKNYTVTYIWGRVERESGEEEQEEKGKKKAHARYMLVCVFSMKSQLSLSKSHFREFCCCHFVQLIAQYGLIALKWNRIEINWSHLRFNGLLITEPTPFSAAAAVSLASRSRSATLINYWFSLCCCCCWLLAACVCIFIYKLKFESVSAALNDNFSSSPRSRAALLNHCCSTHAPNHHFSLLTLRCRTFMATLSGGL